MSNDEISEEDKKAIAAMVSASIAAARLQKAAGGLTLVGGTDCKPAGTETGSLSEPVFRRPEPSRNSDDPPSTETAKNGWLREKRKQAWRTAEAATRYWRVRIDFDHAVSIAQREEIPEAAYHPIVDSKDLRLVERYREAFVRQLLAPAPDLMSVAWKKAALAGGQYRYVGVSSERIEHAIADDLAFLAAHPIRHNKSKAMVHRRAMRRRIRDVAASRDLSDEEIKPALTLKHQEIARFSEQHGINIEWLLEGNGRIFKKDPIAPDTPND
jgi:hypothetical protein